MKQFAKQAERTENEGRPPRVTRLNFVSVFTDNGSLTRKGVSPPRSFADCRY